MYYRLVAKNRIFEANRTIVEYEIRPGNTVTFVAEVDLTQVQRLRTTQEASKASYTAFVVKAVALALRRYPYANRRVCRRGWWPFAGHCLQAFERCDIAVAAERDIPDIEYCAFVDIVRDADGAGLSDIDRQLSALATCDVHTNEQWRSFSGVVTRFPHWLSTHLIRLPYYFPGFWLKFRGASVLISSPAKYGVDSVVATWSWPLGVSFGFVKDRPVVRDGAVVPCPTFNLVVNFDRRVMAGAQGARFFREIVRILESAESEMAAFLRESGTETTAKDPAATGK